MKIKFDVAELPDSPNEKFVYRTEIREYPDETLRDNLWCTICGFDDYPNCCDKCKDYPAAKAKGFDYDEIIKD